LEVVNQVKEKIKHMTAPKNFSIIPVLIHANGISESLEGTQFFPYILNITDFTL
jgi:hypothetical protein